MGIGEVSSPIKNSLRLRSVKIAQWDSSLSVLPVARVMIAQWDSSLSVLPVAQTRIAQWDSSMSVFPVAPGYDSSVG